MPFQNAIFVNIPVSSLPKSLSFYTALGFVKNDAFSNEQAAMVVLPLQSDTKADKTPDSPINIMLLTHPFFTTFLPKSTEIADTGKTAQSIICFSRESKEAVDEMVKIVGENGGKTDIREKSEMEKEMEVKGVMYGAAFTDPDGHILECVWMPEDMGDRKGCVGA